MPSPRKQAQNTIKAVSPTVKYKKYSTTADPRLGTKVILPTKLMKPIRVSCTRQLKRSLCIVENSQSARGGAQEYANTDSRLAAEASCCRASQYCRVYSPGTNILIQGTDQTHCDLLSMTLFQLLMSLTQQLGQMKCWGAGWQQRWTG